MEKTGVRVGAVLLAAGVGSRFGSNKLLADFKNRPMVCCAMEAMKALPVDCAAAVVSDDRVAALAVAAGLAVVRNDAPQLGQARSIRLGMERMLETDAVLLMVADQPRLTQDSLLALLDAFVRSSKGIACLADETHRGNPAVFSARYFPALMALEGDRGAKGILRAHEADLTVVRCLHTRELSDADDPQALRMLQEAAE